MWYNENMEKTLHQQTIEAGQNHHKGGRLSFEVVAIIFRACPFCGMQPAVFEVPEKRYGDNSPWSWNIECPNMGCIFRRPETGDQSLKHLADRWNGIR